MELADVEVMKPPKTAIRIDPPIEVAMSWWTTIVL